MIQRTAQYQLLETKLGTPLHEYLAERRASGLSWQTIRDELVAATGVRVTPTSLRNWFAEDADLARTG